MSAAYSAMVRSLENFPEQRRSRSLGAPRRWICVALHEPSVCLEIRSEVGQVQVVVAMRQQQSRNGAKTPARGG